MDREYALVRPVSARTWQNTIRGSAPEGAAPVNLYHNALYTEPGADRNNCNAQVAACQQKRLQRLQESIAAATLCVSPAAPPLQPASPGGTATARSVRKPELPTAAPSGALQEAPGQAALAKASLRARGLAAVYDPELDELAGGARAVRRDPALRLAASPAVVIEDADLRAFLMQPGPGTGPIQCVLTRERRGAKLFPEYALHLEVGRRFLLAARKRKKSASAHYLLSSDSQDLSRGGGSFCGKVRANFLGTEFVAYDRGAKPGSTAAIYSRRARAELAAVTYQANLLGAKGPRRMTALIPRLDAAGRRAAFCPAADGPRGGMLDKQRRGEDLGRMTVLRNKAPRWNDALGAYCLNFGGRVTHASVKNFQLAADDNPDHIVLQFGKVGPDMFTLDFQAPMSALQAFAICLSSFDHKLACE
ncbi:hypothetical protein WJX81_007666 [Elliptochloris bilobata]|uniref:Tubby C-terminal domain-containing protein n=1 Tax=Elliptochloris bilobata TaxID=381761 RepID=A0AAW1RX98_9CHLO